MITEHRRRSIRLKGYDYTQPGAYFVTICTHNRQCLFGDITDAGMVLNDGGKAAERCWSDIPSHFPHVELDAFVVMPNHVHGILVIADVVGAKNISPLPSGTSKTVGSVVRGFKIGVTKWFRNNTNVRDVWQRNYYEHVIRDDESLNHIRQYIAENGLCWHLDWENPHRVGEDDRWQTLFQPEVAT